MKITEMAEEILENGSIVIKEYDWGLWEILAQYSSASDAKNHEEREHKGSYTEWKRSDLEDVIQYAVEGVYGDVVDKIVGLGLIE